MTTFISNTELQSVVREKYGRGRRERVMLTPHRRDGLRKMARALMSLIF